MFPLVSRPPRYPLCGPWEVESVRAVTYRYLHVLHRFTDKGAQQPYGAKAEPLPPPFAPTLLRFPFLRCSFSLFVVPSLHFSLSVSLLSRLSRTPLYPYPPRTLQFSNGFVLADYVSQRSTYLPCCKVYVRAGMFIIRTLILARYGVRVSEAVVHRTWYSCWRLENGETMIP